MNEQKTLTKLANMFHIAPSALRYWDKEGLIRFERFTENNYRFPTMQSMLDICDVILNRSLSIPIKAMKKVPEMNAKQLEELLLQNEAKLLQQKEEIQRTIKRIHRKQRMLKRFHYLQQQHTFIVEQRAFPAIKEFSFEEEQDIQTFVHNSNQSAVVLVPGKKEQYGLFTKQSQVSLLREADTEEKNYLRGLLRISSDNTADSNCLDFFQEAQRLGSSANSIFGRYLISVYDEKRYDYYEAWTELSYKVESKQ